MARRELDDKVGASGDLSTLQRILWNSTRPSGLLLYRLWCLHSWQFPPYLQLLLVVRCTSTSDCAKEFAMAVDALRWELHHVRWLQLGSNPLSYLFDPGWPSD